MKKIVLIFAVIATMAITGRAVSLPEYHEDMLKSYGIADYLERAIVKKNLPGIKIAILERGFAGAEEEGNLPPGSIIVNQYDEEMINQFDLNPGYEAPPANEAHGRRVAQLVWAMTGMSYDVAPQIYLLNANGLTNFRRAVRYAIQEKVDIIVYAQNWEYGGNYDGEGFVNATVYEAIEAGITWINAAGNYGKAVYNDSIQTTEEGDLLFSKVNRSQNKDKLFFSVKSDEKDVRVLCVWNDFSTDRDYQAVKDLDLYIYEYDGDKLGNIVGQSAYAQITVDSSVSEELSQRQSSQLAREEVFLSTLRKDKRYAVVIRDVSKNFSESKDKIRVIVQANEGVLTFDDYTEGGEIMIPADNRDVIAVGDLSESSSSGPTVDFRRKPEVILPPWIREGQTNVYSEIPYAVFSDDVVVAGTSADAAIFGGMVAVYKANKPGITRTELLMIAGRLQAQWRSRQIEVTEPEYTVTESSPVADAETPVVEERTVIVEREIVTVYSNPFFVGGGAVIIESGPVFLPPPIIVVNRPVVIPVYRPLPPGPPPPPHAGFHRSHRNPNMGPPRDGGRPPGRNGMGEGPRNGRGEDNVKNNPPGKGNGTGGPPSGNLDGKRPERPVEREKDMNPRPDLRQGDAIKRPSIGDYHRRQAQDTRSRLTTPKPSPEKMRPFDENKRPTGKYSVSEMDIPKNIERSEARQNPNRENANNRSAPYQTRISSENARVMTPGRSAVQGPQPDLRNRPSGQNRSTPEVRTPAPTRSSGNRQVVSPIRPTVQTQPAPQARPSVQNRSTPEVRTPAPTRSSGNRQVVSPMRPRVQPQPAPQVRPSVQNRSTPVVRTPAPTRLSENRQVVSPVRPRVQPQPVPQLRPSSPSPVIRQRSSEPSRMAVPPSRERPDNRGIGGNPGRRR